MKDYLFRGKRKDNGEWVYGYYVNCADEYEPENRVAEIIEVDADRIYKGEYNHFHSHPVIPETVGMYICLDDMDGYRVFEGDILESPVKPIGAKYGTLIVITDIRHCNIAHFFISDYKIIGNIYDNPELMLGRWEKYDDTEFCYCSKCGKPTATDDNVSWHSYCPICGDKKQKEVVKI